MHASALLSHSIAAAFIPTAVTAQLVKCLLKFQNEAQKVISFSEDERENSFKDPIQKASTLVYTSL